MRYVFLDIDSITNREKLIRNVTARKILHESIINFKKGVGKLKRKG